MELDQEYNDNLYLTGTNPVREIVSYIGGGIILGFKTKKNQIDLNYKLRQVFHWDYEKNDDIDTTKENYLAQNLNLNMATQLASRLKVGVSEFYLRSRRPRDYYLMTNRISRAHYWANRISPFLEYELGKRFFLSVRYKHDVLRYTERYYIYDENSTENRGYLTLKYRLNPKNAIDLDYQYWQRNYEIFPSYQTHQITIGYERLFRLLKIQMRGGYLRRNWEKETPGLLKNWQGFVYRVSARVKTKKSHASLGLEETQSDITGLGSDYHVRMLLWDIGHTFLGKISIDLGGFYQQCRYSELLTLTEAGIAEKRRDNIWNITIAIRYPMHKWLELGLEFIHTARDSNSIDPIWGDFVENRIIFTIRPRYETKK